MTENTLPTRTSTVARIRRRVARTALALAVPAAAVAVPALGAAPAQAAGDCTTDCVAVTITPGVDRFAFAVGTTTSARISARITTDGGATTVATTSTPGYTTSTSLSVSNLAQGVSYRYEVHGTDAAGNTWREVGWFSTLVRSVSVDWGTFQLTDDSDSGGAGELVGGVQLLSSTGATCAMKGLAPLNLSSTTSMSSGSPVSVPTTANLACSGTTPAVWVQSHLADDDTDSWDDCDSWWPWSWDNGSWGARHGSNSCADWNYGTGEVVDPLPALGTGSKSVSFTHASAEGDILDGDTGPEWILTGSATFSHQPPAATLPAMAGGPAKMPLAVAAKRGGFAVGWTPQSVPGVTFSRYAVQYRRSGTTTWSTQLVDAPTKTATVTGLDPLAAYDVQVLAEDINGNRHLRSTTTVTTQALTDATTIAGWLPGGDSQPVGSEISFTATVSGDPRPVLLQTRREGSDAWTTHATLSTNAADEVSGSYPVTAGMHEWRLHAPQSGFSEAASSPVRHARASSVVTGFSTTKTVVRVGTVVRDRITVTPGAGRQVVVQHRKPGGARWRTFARPTASGTGRVTVRLEAFPGSRTWRVKVAESVDHGTETVSGTRVVRGR
jgi:hypothetical protein